MSGCVQTYIEEVWRVMGTAGLFDICRKTATNYLVEVVEGGDDIEAAEKHVGGLEPNGPTARAHNGVVHKIPASRGSVAWQRRGSCC